MTPQLPDGWQVERWLDDHDIGVHVPTQGGPYTTIHLITPDQARALAFALLREARHILGNGAMVTHDDGGDDVSDRWGER